jgi:hypothetical protein
MHTTIALLLICVFARSTSGHDSVPSQATADLEPIAVSTIHVDKHRFKSGEAITLTILLEAGRDGVYIPKTWGEMGGGIPGFSASLTTESGKQAETCGSAVDGYQPSEPDPTVALNRDFIFLAGQHIVGLKTTIPCPTKRRGQYHINAFYSPTDINADKVAQLPETHGLVLQKSVQAKPVTISIY